MFLFCLGNYNKYLKTFKLNSPLNVNFLSFSQKNLANKFSSNMELRWQDTQYSLNKNKVPFFDTSLGLIEGKVFKKIKSGDHTIIICTITDYYNLTKKKPLIYYKSKFQTI